MYVVLSEGSLSDFVCLGRCVTQAGNKLLNKSPCVVSPRKTTENHCYNILKQKYEDKMYEKSNPYLQIQHLNLNLFEKDTA